MGGPRTGAISFTITSVSFLQNGHSKGLMLSLSSAYRPKKCVLKRGGFPQVNFVGNNNKTKNLTTWKTKLNLQKNSYK